VYSVNICQIQLLKGFLVVAEDTCSYVVTEGITKALFDITPFGHGLSIGHWVHGKLETLNIV